MNRYYCTHGSESEAEARRCEQCRKRARIVEQGAMRACSDCEGYTPSSTMIRKLDGRIICQACQKAIDNRARDRAQADLFVQQPALF